MLEDSFSKSKDYQPTAREWLTSAWNGKSIPAFSYFKLWTDVI